MTRGRFSAAGRGCDGGSVLILVLWISFGLVAIALYFAHSMSVELQAADNRVASAEADQAIEGAALYVSNILANLQTPNTVPNPLNFHPENVKVGNAHFWLIGRDTNVYQVAIKRDHPFWGLIDEAGKLNLNTATPDQLEWLPGMGLNQSLNDYIYDWRTTSTEPTNNGAKSETYSIQPIPYECKNTNYETAEELRLVYTMNMDLLYGEDANLNGMLDPNENDGDALPPHDNQDGQLNSGLLEYVTTWTHEGNVSSNGISRVVVTNIEDVSQLFSNKFPSFMQYLEPFQEQTGPTGGGGRGNINPIGNTTANPPNSTLDFYIRSGMSQGDFEQVEPYLMNGNSNGLVNVTDASATVLAAVLDDTNVAAEIINYRQSTPPLTPTITWVASAIGSDDTVAQKIGPYLTPYTFQYTADIAAVGHNGRGYRRVKFVFDTSSGVPQIVYREDLTYLGWALGKNLYDELASNIK